MATTLTAATIDRNYFQGWQFAGGGVVWQTGAMAEAEASILSAAIANDVPPILATHRLL